MPNLPNAPARCIAESIESYIECGRVLLEAREVADHGQWGEFLHQAGIPERTAPTHDATRARRNQNPTRCRIWAAFGRRLMQLRPSKNGRSRPAHGGSKTAGRTRRYWRRLRLMTRAHFGARFAMRRRKIHPSGAAIVQAAPDGPWSTSRWIDFTDALITAETEDQKRDAMTLAPWKKEAA